MNTRTETPTLLRADILRDAVVASLAKLDPRTQLRNPVMFAVYLASILTTLLWVPLSLPAALTVWKWPDAATWPWLALCGFLGTAGHYFWTRALRLADASLLAPFSYLQLIIVAVLAWILFGEALDRYTAIGAAIIITATLYIARREAMLARKRHTERVVGLCSHCRHFPRPLGMRSRGLVARRFG